MLREYIVTIERSDRTEPDPIEIFAADRDDAIKAVKSIYRKRCLRVLRARLRHAADRKREDPLQNDIELDQVEYPASFSRIQTSSSLEL